MNRRADEHHNAGAGWVVLAIALAARSLAVWFWQSQLVEDPDAYRQIAANLSLHGVFGLDGSAGPVATAFRPFLYPLALSVLSPSGPIGDLTVGIFNIGLGTATAWLVFRIAQVQFAEWKMPAGNVAAVLAGCLFALDPIALNQTALAMTESLACFLTALSLFTYQRLRGRPTILTGIAFGISMGLTLLCRPSFFAWLGLLLIPLGFAAIRTRQSRSAAIAALVTIALTVAPWMIRNSTVMGKTTPTTTHGGYTLLLGNNRLFYQHLEEQPWREVWDGSRFDKGWLRRHASDDPKFDFWSDELMEQNHLDIDQFPRNEIEDDAFAYEVAFEHIQENPQTFAVASVVKLFRLWSPLPHATGTDSRRTVAMRWMVGAWYSLVYLSVGFALWTHRQRKLTPLIVAGLLLVLALSVVHTFYWSNMRMRAPAMLTLYVLAGSLAGLIDPLRKKRAAH